MPQQILDQVELAREFVIVELAEMALDGAVHDHPDEDQEHPGQQGEQGRQADRERGLEAQVQASSRISST